MNLAIKVFATLSIITWTLFPIFWLGAIWTTGTDPLSIQLGYTACVMLFFGALFSIVWAVTADEAKRQ